MARIPQNITVSPRFQGVDMPAGVFNATAQAVAGVVGAVGGAVETVKHFADEAQKVRNDMDLRGINREMQMKQAAFYEEVGKNAIDPSQWTTEWRNRLGSFAGELASRKVSPVVLQAANAQFMEFEGRSLISISAAALKEDRRRATGSWEIDHNDDVKNGRFDREDASVNEAEKTGLLDPLQAKAARFEIKYARENDMMGVDMQLDPDKFIKDVEAGNYSLSPAKRVEFVQQARAWKAKTERSSMAMVTNAMEKGAFKTEGELKEELDRYPEISKATKSLIVENYGNTKPLGYEEKAKVTDYLRQEMKRYLKGEISAEEYGKTHDEVTSAVLAMGERQGVGALKSFIHNYDPVQLKDQDGAISMAKANNLENTPASIGKDLIKERSQALVSLAVARVKDKNGNAEMSATARGKEEQKSVIFRAAMEDKLNQFLFERKANPPSSAEVKDFLDKVQVEVVMGLAFKPTAKLEPQKGAAVPKAVPAQPVDPAQMTVPEMDEYNKWMDSGDRSVLPPKR